MVAVVSSNPTEGIFFLLFKTIDVNFVQKCQTCVENEKPECEISKDRILTFKVYCSIHHNGFYVRHSWNFHKRYKVNQRFSWVTAKISCCNKVTSSRIWFSNFLHSYAQLTLINTSKFWKLIGVLTRVCTEIPLCHPAGSSINSAICEEISKFCPNVSQSECWFSCLLSTNIKVFWNLYLI